jgi:hypothetical protein
MAFKGCRHREKDFIPLRRSGLRQPLKLSGVGDDLQGRAHAAFRVHVVFSWVRDSGTLWFGTLLAWASEKSDSSRESAESTGLNAVSGSLMSANWLPTSRRSSGTWSCLGGWGSGIFVFRSSMITVLPQHLALLS